MRVNLKAQAWRHWYSTLNQMLADMTPKDREEIIITTLPDEVTIAGEWYLGVPIYSAAPDVALEMIKLLTSHEAEMERMRLGIGLPTRSRFFGGGDAACTSRYLSLPPIDLEQFVSRAFRRSDFDCYSQLANTLAFYLQRILEIPKNDDSHLKQEIAHIFKDMDTRMGFVRPGPDCSKCSSFNPSIKPDGGH